MLQLVILLLIILSLGSLAYGALSAAPFLPLKKKDTKRLLDLAASRPGELLYDLGCGDGRIIIAAAREYNLQGVGFEIAIIPYLIARIKVMLYSRLVAKIYLKNFWNENLTKADVVVCFLTPLAMIKLLPKLQAELKPGARFISYAFPLPGITPTTVSKPLRSDINIYLYTNFVRPVGKVVDI